MADFRNLDEDGEYLQKVQNYEQPHSSKYAPQELSRTDGGYDDADIEETVSERLLGLAEMFPPSIRHAGAKALKYMDAFVKGTYRFACNFSWFAFSTTIILFAPLIFEYERNNKDDERKRRQRTQGPSTVVTA